MISLKRFGPNLSIDGIGGALRNGRMENWPKQMDLKWVETLSQRQNIRSVKVEQIILQHKIN